MSDEGRRIVTYNEIEAIQKYRKDFYGNPLYVVENSQFSNWIAFESAGFFIDLNHYVIITIDHIVDILSFQSPEITICDN